MKIEQLKQRPAGEPMVWLTGMGLALGTVMVAYLLWVIFANGITCLLYTSPSPRDAHESRMPSSA